MEYIYIIFASPEREKEGRGRGKEERGEGRGESEREQKSDSLASRFIDLEKVCNPPSSTGVDGVPEGEDRMVEGTYEDMTSRVLCGP